jgi:hypothetical protein
MKKSNWDLLDKFPVGFIENFPVGFFGKISGGFISENFRWVHRDITRSLSNRFNRWKSQIAICWTNFWWVSSNFFPVGFFGKISGGFPWQDFRWVFSKQIFRWVSVCVRFCIRLCFLVSTVFLCNRAVFSVPKSFWDSLHLKPDSKNWEAVTPKSRLICSTGEHWVTQGSLLTGVSFCLSVDSNVFTFSSFELSTKTWFKD